MERMGTEVFREEIPRPYSSFINELEEENKKLNEEIQRFKDNAMQDMREITELEIENKKLKEDVEYFRQIYLDLKKLCEKEGFMLSDEEVTKMFNLDEIR